MKLLHRLFSHYVEYHRHSPLMLRYLSMAGFIFFPLYYLLRFAKGGAPVYDDWLIRVVNAALCLILFLRERWPEKWKPYFFHYSYLVLMVSMPLTFMFTSLKHGGGTVAVGNTLMAAFVVLLLADWRNMIVILAGGFALGTALYVGTDADPRMPVDYVARLPILLAVIIGGSLFKFALERATSEKVRSAYAALAGSIAHEMRNPLAQIKHSLEDAQQLLPASKRSEPLTLTPAELQGLYRCVAQGELAVKRGLQVISMTLDEVKAKPLDPQSFAYLSAAEVCAKAVNDYGYEDEEQRSHVVLRVRQDFTFRADETAYLFVLFNLIKNALYYIGRDPHTRVTITVDGHEIRVRDNGPGIPPDALEHLFEPFRSEGKSGGTGLGLAYCDRVMRAIGGEITCTSVQGDHTEFAMRFPVVSERELADHRLAIVQQARSVLAGKRILIVEDDPIQRVATQQKLGTLALTADLDVAVDGPGALQMLQRRAYDIVLLDLHLPGLDGYAVAERVRAEPGVNRDVRILAYTSEPAHVARDKALKRGMDGFVNKPCAQLPLLTALVEVVQQRQGPSAAAMADLAGRRVLLADDSSFNRRAVAAYLRAASASVVEADDGEGALEHLFSQGGFDVVLLDLQMPGMDGLETARAIRSSGESWASVPVIALTARSDDAAVNAVREAGMTALLVKPVEASLLYETIAATVAGKPPASPLVEGADGISEVQEALEAGLLNLPRLESYRRLGMLDELVNDYQPEITRLVEELQVSAGGDDRDASLAALHSLLGMTGEAGAQAMYQHVRRMYVPLLEQQQWPVSSAWLEQLRELTQRTQEALRAYCAANATRTE